MAVTGAAAFSSSFSIAEMMFHLSAERRLNGHFNELVKYIIKVDFSFDVFCLLQCIRYLRFFTIAHILFDLTHYRSMAFTQFSV